MADNDKSETGEKAAIETTITWSMPDNIGMDWNDVHAQRGLLRLRGVKRFDWKPINMDAVPNFDGNKVGVRT